MYIYIHIFIYIHIYIYIYLYNSQSTSVYSLRYLCLIHRLLSRRRMVLAPSPVYPLRYPRLIQCLRCSPLRCVPSGILASPDASSRVNPTSALPPSTVCPLRYSRLIQRLFPRRRGPLPSTRTAYASAPWATTRRSGSTTQRSPSRSTSFESIII